MIDLANVNPGPIDFHRLRRVGQERVYLKATQGDGSLSTRGLVRGVDRFCHDRRRRAHRAGLKVGLYHFGEPGTNDPRVEARLFARVLGTIVPGLDLRPCLDFELGRPDAAWAAAFLGELRRLTGVAGIIYSYPDFLRRAHFAHMPAPLWLASYGRNDGREHRFDIPAPWKHIVAHQYASRARIAGVPGFVDISHVYDFHALEVPPAV